MALKRVVFLDASVGGGAGNEHPSIVSLHDVATFTRVLQLRCMHGRERSDDNGKINMENFTFFR